VKLKRGLSLILGDVGTGKTTLSRLFVQQVAHERQVLMRMVLNPMFENERDFLSEICQRFAIAVDPCGKASTYYNALENYLFQI
jgi:general secretion pathway protein A